MTMPKELDPLRRRVAPLEMSAEEFRRAGHDLIDTIAGLLASLPEGPVNHDETPAELRALLPRRSPETGESAHGLLQATASLLFQHSLYNGHPRFFGYITSSAAPIGALADLLAAAVNPNLGAWQLSPLASEIERQCVAWIAELLGYPTAAGGLLVSGGNMANFVGFLAGRRAKTDEAMRTKGLGSVGARLLFYASEETHTWLHKAADLFGHGTDSIRWIPVDRRRRIDIGALRRQIETDKREGHRPVMVIGNAGTVGTGAVDPLEEIAAVAREHDLWFHADGAYGAFGVLAPAAPPELHGLSLADSVAVDPHKWLYVPLEAGCVLVRDPAVLPDAFGYTPPYYRFTGEEEEPRINYYEWGLQNSRGFRALKVWLGLRQVGRAGYARMISDDIRLAAELFRLAESNPELEPFTHELSIATFRYVPPDLDLGSSERESYLDRLNEEVRRRLAASGEAFLSNTIVDGKFVLRACIVNFRTRLEDIEALPEIVTRHGREADRDLRLATAAP